jgi:hypothetical protein
MHFDSNLIDSSTTNTLVTFNNGSDGSGLTSDQSVFGGYSYFQNGTTSDLSIDNNSGALDFGLGDGCVEGWFRWNSLVPSDANILWIGTTGMGVYHDGISQWVIDTEGNVQTGTLAISTGQWYHVALTKKGSVAKLYVNGNKIVEKATNDITWGSSIGLGSHASGWRVMNGYIDEFRVEVGNSVYEV